MTKTAKDSQQSKNVEKLVTYRDVMLMAVEAQGFKDEFKESTTQVSQQLMVLSRRFIDGKTKKLDIDLFLNACKAEEKFIKSKDAGKNQVDRIPDCWIQAKSNIKAAAKFDISPADYKTESAMRKALNEARKAAKDQAIEQEAGEVEGQKLVARQVSADISPVIAGLAELYKLLDDEEKDSLKSDLVSLHAKYRKVASDIVMGDIKKAKDPSTTGLREPMTAEQVASNSSH